MASRGRKPAPPEQKALKGERPGRINPAAPTPPDGVGEPPEILDEEGVRQWHRFAPVLARMGVLKESDADALALYCEHYSRWVVATKEIRKYGLTSVCGTGGEKVAPAVGIARESMAAMLKLLAEFGCTPSSRSRVRVEAEGPKDDLAEFLGK
jgi:P27 family predicted phage terminase small subunit